MITTTFFDFFVGSAGAAAALIGLLFGLTSASVLARSWSERARGSLSPVVGFFVLFGFGLYYGLESIHRAHDIGPVDGIAWVMIASLSVGISRAWELVGLPDTGAVSSIRLILGGFSGPGRRQAKASSTPTGADDAAH